MSIFSKMSNYTFRDVLVFQTDACMPSLTRPDGRLISPRLCAKLLLA